MINTALNKLINKDDVSDIDFREVFDEITSGVADSNVVSAFVAALCNCELTSQNLSDIIISASESVEKINLQSGCLMENLILTDRNDVLDVSLASNLVCCACGLEVSQYTFDSPFYKEKNRSYNILHLMGINVFDKTEILIQEFEKLKFGYFYLSLNSPYFKYTSTVSRLLTFRNIFNITDVFLNPYGCKNRVIGVEARDDVLKYADISLKLNFENSLVMSGYQGLPYITIEGESFVAEAWKNKIFNYVITPSLLGFDGLEGKSDVKTESDSQNAQILLDVFRNKLKDSVSYITIVVNSALALYISKKAPSVMDALDMAKNAIDSGLVEEKIEQIKRVLN